ncbi:excisionase family DNA-binding protein [Xanthobacter sediminis]
MTDAPRINGDVLFGASAIAEHLATTRQRVYRLAAQGRIPFFRVGNMVCARRSALAEWMLAQERRNTRGTR